MVTDAAESHQESGRRLVVRLQPVLERGTEVRDWSEGLTRDLLEPETDSLIDIEDMFRKQTDSVPITKMHGTVSARGMHS